MICFIYTGKTQVLSKACELANAILLGSMYHVKIREIAQFDYSDNGKGKKVTGPEMDVLISTSDLHIKINEYRTFWPWSKVNGYTTSKDACYFNTRKLTNNPADMVGTLAHEMVHCLNFANQNINIGHADNYYSVKKESSAPYMSASIAYKLAEELLTSTKS